MDLDELARANGMPEVCYNFTEQIKDLLYWHHRRQKSSAYFYDDSSNSYKYIVFILVIYAVSFISLMFKYFWKSREGKQYEQLYDEFVKRDGFKKRASDVRLVPVARRGTGKKSAGAATAAVTRTLMTDQLATLRLPKPDFESRSASLMSHSSSLCTHHHRRLHPDAIEVVVDDYDAAMNNNSGGEDEDGDAINAAVPDSPPPSPDADLGSSTEALKIVRVTETASVSWLRNDLTTTTSTGSRRSSSSSSSQRPKNPPVLVHQDGRIDRGELAQDGGV